MKNPAKLFWNWMDQTSLLLALAAWLVFAVVVFSSVYPGSLDMQLWCLGVLEAMWLACAVGFLLGYASWWEQKKDRHKISLAAKGGCFLTGLFVLFPFLNYLCNMLFLFVYSRHS